MTEPIRLARRVADIRGCSRSEAERYIEGGWVRVDGRVVEDPATRVGTETVTLDTGATLLDTGPVTLLLNQPAGTAAPLELLRPETLAAGGLPVRVLRKHFKGLTALAPLPRGGCGLAVFTQDWRVARKLTDELAWIEQEFTADLKGAVEPDALLQVARVAPPAALKASVGSRNEARTLLRLALKGVDPARVPGWCGQAGLQLQALRRQRLGRVALAGLPEGRWRYLQPHERF